MSAPVPQEAPQWFKRFWLAFRAETLNGPLGLKGYVSTALPDPAATPGSIISVSDTGTVAYSDGSFWYPLTKGTHY